jgi:hypothetical protein
MEFPKRGGLFESNDMIRIPAKVEEVYVARHVGRLALGTSYPDVARHIAELVESLVQRGISRPRIIVDSTGVGAPVVDILREALKGRARDLIAATFTHGDKYTQNDESHQRQGSTASVGKAYLVSRLQALLQTNRLKLPKTPETEALARELKDYEIRIDQDANDKYGAFKVGTHDDLVTALGLTVVYRKPLSRRSCSIEAGCCTDATAGTPSASPRALPSLLSRLARSWATLGGFLVCPQFVR